MLFSSVFLRQKVVVDTDQGRGLAGSSKLSGYLSILILVVVVLLLYFPVIRFLLLSAVSCTSFIVLFCCSQVRMLCYAFPFYIFAELLWMFFIEPRVYQENLFTPDSTLPRFHVVRRHGVFVVPLRSFERVVQIKSQIHWIALSSQGKGNFPRLYIQ